MILIDLDDDAYGEDYYDNSCDNDVVIRLRMETFFKEGNT